MENGCLKENIATGGFQQSKKQKCEKQLEKEGLNTFPSLKSGALLKHVNSQCRQKFTYSDQIEF